MKTFDKKFSVIFPTAGDPLIMWMWFQNFRKYRHLTDQCFVGVDFCKCMEDNDPTELVFMVEYLREFFKERDVENFIIRKCVSQHGLNVSLILEKFKDKISDNVLIAEEDDYVSAVNKLENNVEYFLNNDIDILGPPIYIDPAIPGLADVYREVIKSKNMKVENVKYEDRAFTFWPATYLIKKPHLYNSNMSFGASSYKAGEKTKFFDRDHVWARDISFDTFIRFTFDCMNNPNVKKIVHVQDFHRNYLTDPILFSSEKSIHDVLDFHVGGTSAFIYNRFWDSKLYEAGAFYSRLKLINDRDKVYMHLVDYYRTTFVIYNFMISMRDKNKFPFYDNYKKNMETIIDLYENEYKVNDKIGRMVDGMKGGLDKWLYDRIAKKIF